MRHNRRPRAIRHLEQLESRETPTTAVVNTAFGWVNALEYPAGTDAENTTTPHSVAKDALNNVYVAGTFKGTVDFDPGVGVVNLSAAGGGDVYVAKYTALGALAWVRQARSEYYNSATASGIAVDAAGGVYVTGTTDYTTDFGTGGVSQFPSDPSYQNAYIWKLDSAGNFAWVTAAGAGAGPDDTTTPPAGYSYAQGIALDGSGSVYATGYYFGTVDFDPYFNTERISNSNSSDIFVWQLNTADGSLTRVTTAGGAGDEYGYGIATDAASNVYVTGQIGTTAVDFDPGAGTQNRVGTNSGSAFVWKLNSDGTFGYATTTSGASESSGRSIAVDPAGNAHVVGYTGYSSANLTTFGTGATAVTRANAGYVDTFAWKLNATSTSTVTTAWATTAGGNDPTLSQSQVYPYSTQINSVANTNAVTLDPSGNVYVSGRFDLNADFDLTALTGAVTAAATTIPVRNAASLPAAPGFQILIDSEVMTVTAVSGNSLTVTRAQAGTTSADHIAGSVVKFVTTLSATATATATTLTVQTVSGLPATFPYQMRIEGEVVNVTAAAGNVLTVQRGQAGTTAAVHGFGAIARTAVRSKTSAGSNDSFVWKLTSGGAFAAVNTSGGAGDDGGSGIAATVLTSGTTLSAAASLNGTSVSVVTASTTLPTTAGFQILIDNEVMTVTSINGNTLSVTRAQAGTTNATHALGAAVKFVVTLTAAATAADTNFTVASVAGLPATFPFQLKIGSEYVDVTAVSGNVLTVTRGVGGSIPAAYLVNTTAQRVSATSLTAVGSVSDGLATPTVTGYAQTLDSGALTLGTRIGGPVTPGSSRILGTALDSSGNVYVAGWFSGVVDFDPGVGKRERRSAGGTDGFVARYTPAGVLSWVSTFGGTGADMATGVVAGEAGSVYVSGSFSGTANFNPAGGAVTRTSAGSTDGVALKLTSAGAFSFATAFGGTGADVASGVAADADGVYLTGTFSGPNANFGTTAVPQLRTSVGGTDIFALKLTTAGVYSWASTAGGAANDTGNGIAVDATAVLVTGSYEGLTDFDPTSGTTTLSNAGSTDAFVWRLTNGGGTLVWAAGLGGNLADVGNAITTDATGNVYVGGIFRGTATFGAAGDKTAVGGTDGFVTKLTSGGVVEWVSPFGSIGNDSVNGVAVDFTGNVYFTGTFVTSTDVDPSAGTVTVSVVGGGSTDAIAVKLNSTGGLVWSNVWGGTGAETAAGVRVDGSGNVYLGGSFQNAVDFRAGTLTTERSMYTVPREAGFLLKLTQPAVGTLGFAAAADQANASANTSRVLATALDAAGNVYTTGTFSGTVDFDPSAGVSSLASAGNSDVYVAKSTAAGALIWVRKVGGTSADTVSAIAVDGGGNVHIAGTFAGTVDFDPGAGTASRTSAGGTDAFVLKLTTDGDFLWSATAGGAYADVANGLAVNTAGDVYVTGGYRARADFDPSAGVANLVVADRNITSSSSLDAFLWKLNASGGLVWARSAGGTADDIGRAVTVDGGGSVIVTGQFESYNADFDPGPAQKLLSTAGGRDVFVWKVSGGGTAVWAKSVGSYTGEVGTGVAADAAGNIYVTGTFSGTVDFDPGTGTAALVSRGGSDDVFVLKLTSTGAFVWATSAGSDANDTAGGIALDSTGQVYIAGGYTGTLWLHPDPVSGDTPNRLVASAGAAATSGSDAFVWKLNSAGGFVAARTAGSGGSNPTVGTSLAVRSGGLIYIGGSFRNTLNPNRRQSGPAGTVSTFGYDTALLWGVQL